MINRINAKRQILRHKDISSFSDRMSYLMNVPFLLIYGATWALRTLFIKSFEIGEKTVSTNSVEESSVLHGVTTVAKIWSFAKLLFRYLVMIYVTTSKP